LSSGEKIVSAYESLGQVYSVELLPRQGRGDAFLSSHVAWVQGYLIPLMAKRKVFQGCREQRLKGVWMTPPFQAQKNIYLGSIT